MPSATKVQTGYLEAVNPFTIASGTASAPIISFSDSTATGIFSPSTGALGFSTGSTQNALTILSDGRVGIGNTNPSRLVHIASSSADAGVAVDGGSAAAAYIDFRIAGANKHYIGGANLLGAGPSNNDMTVWNSSNGYLNFGTNGTEKVRISASGNVGIGTTDPQSDLDIRNTGIIRVSNGTQIGWFGATNTAYGFWYSGINTFPSLAIGTSTNHPIIFATNNVGRLIVNSDGNVGIGTTNPYSTLSVSVSNNDDGLTLHSTQVPTGGAGPAVVFRHNTNNGTPQNFAKIKSTMRGGNDVTWYSDLSFYVGGNNLAEHLTIRYNGNVGIGTNDPTSKFHVVGTTSLVGNTLLYNTPGNDVVNLQNYDGSALSFGDELGINFLMGNEVAQFTGNPAARIASYLQGGGNQFGLKFYTRDGGTQSNYFNRMTITGSGSVGIGTDNTNSCKLDVNGNLRLGTITIGENAGRVVNANLSLLRETTYNTASNMSIEMGAFNTNAGNFGGAYRWRISMEDAMNASLAFSTVNAPSDTYNGYGTVNERVRLTPAGNVGIGTANPSTNLEIYQGSIKLGHDSNHYIGWRYSAGDNNAYSKIANIYDTTNSEVGVNIIGGQYTSAQTIPVIRLRARGDGNGGTYGYDALTILNNRNVGIGTTNPNANLDVRGWLKVENNTNAEGAQLFLRNTNTGSGAYSVIRFSQSADIGLGSDAYIHFFNSNWASNGYWDAKSLASGTADGNINFWVGGNNIFKIWTNNTPRLYVLGDGNVGINNTNPICKLQVTNGNICPGQGFIRMVQGYKSTNNTNAFDMIYIDGIGREDVTELIIKFGHEGGGSHGSYRRIVFTSNAYSVFTVFEDITTNYGGGTGFTLSFPTYGRLKIAWNGATAYSDDYHFICWIRSRANVGVGNYNMDWLSA